jgi:MinD-like ATPase involved in chromosome partitioning or flagellar assembly
VFPHEHRNLRAAARTKQEKTHMLSAMDEGQKAKSSLNKSIAVHSYKGGTGKSNLSANAALLLAKRGWNVVLFDFDFRAPSLSTLFQMNGIQYWLNDWLAQRCEIHEALVDLSDHFDTKGQFQVGFTNPSARAISEMTQHSLSEEWEAKVLQLLLDAKDLLYQQHRVNFQIFDTSPGFALSSINAILASDQLILVVKMDQLDIVGTQQLIRGVYNQVLGKRPQLLLNKVPCSLLKTEEDVNRLRRDIEKQLGVGVIGIIPCYCGVLENQGRELFATKYPLHPFTQSIEQLATLFEKAN